MIPFDLCLEFGCLIASIYSSFNVRLSKRWPSQNQCYFFLFLLPSIDGEQLDRNRLDAPLIGFNVICAVLRHVMNIFPMNAIACIRLFTEFDSDIHFDLTIWCRYLKSNYDLAYLITHNRTAKSDSKIVDLTFRTHYFIVDEDKDLATFIELLCRRWQKRSISFDWSLPAAFTSELHQ